MPVSTPPKRPRGLGRLLKVTLRHTAIHVLNAVLFAFMALLVAVAGLLIFLLSRDDIPLPDFLLRKIEAHLAREGVELSFSRARLDLHGNVLINDLRLEPARFGEPVLEARMLFLNFDELFLAAGMLELTEVRAEGITISCPSTLSPSGSPYPLAHVAGVSARRSGRAWEVSGLLAQCGPVHIVAHGTVTPPPARGTASRLTPAEIINHFATLAPQIARSLAETEGLSDARIELAFEAGRSGDVQVAVEATAGTWTRSGVGEAHEIALSTLLHYRKGAIAPTAVHARAARISRPDGSGLHNAGVLALWDTPPDLRRPVPTRVLVSATRAMHPKMEVSLVSLAAETDALPRVRGTLIARLAGEPVELTVAGDVATRAAEVELRCRLGVHWLEEASRLYGRDLTYYATIAQPPDGWARASIAEGGAWQQVEFRTVTGPIVARGVALDRARVHGVMVPGGVSIDHLEINKGDQGGLGTYTDSFTTRDHRLVLRGSMRPLEISGWFSGWWPRFWNDFTFDGPPPEFDIDVSGNWNIKGRDVVHGRGTARNGSMRGVRYDSLDTRFRIRADHYDLYEATIVRPEGRVTGEVQLGFTPPQRDPALTRFSFESTADLVELARAFGKGGEALLEPYRYTTPPQTRVSGVVTNQAGTFDTVVNVSIETPAEFRYYDFPVASLSTEVRVHNNRVEIPRLMAGYGGGTLRVNATSDQGILSLKASLDNASYDEATRTFSDYLDRRSPPPPEERDPAGLTARPPGGRLSLGIEARGPLTQFDAYEGHGSLRISEANLGSVRIFGVLSSLLGGINPRLGSLRFHEANSTFQVQRDRVHFPDLRINGRTAALETEGTYFVNSRNLDFRARLYPLGEAGNAITQLFDFVLGPVSYLLEMRLTGTVRKPSWSLSRIPFAPKPVVDEGTPGTAATSAPPPAPASPAPAPAARGEDP